MSSTALAAPSVTLLEENDQPLVRVDADKESISAFVKDKSLWVVSDSSEPVDMNIPSNLRKKYNIQAGEALKVNGGHGSRIAFEAVPENITIIDLPAKKVPVSVIGLSEGVILSGVRDAKILTALSNLTGQSVSVIPYAQESAQAAQSFMDGSAALQTFAGYAFEKSNGGALASLYRDRQQFLASNQEKLLSLAKKAPTQKTVLSTRQQTLPKETTKEEINVQAVQPLKAPPAVQNELTNLEPLPALKTPQVSNEESQTTAAVENSTENAPDRLSNALKNIQQATQTLKNIQAPKLDKKRAEKSVKMKKKPEPKMVQVVKEREVEDKFSSFFGNDIAEEDDFTTEAPADETTQKRTVTYVEEVPEVQSKEEAVNYAAEVLGGTNTLEGDVETFSFDDTDSFDDEEFRIPDLDPNEPIFKRYGDGSEEVYQKYQRKLLDELAVAPSQIRRQQHRLRLAKLYMTYERPYEVLMMMENMPKDPDTGMIHDTSARILSGASNIMINRPKDALEHLTVESENFEDDRKLWLAAAYELSDMDDEALDLYEEYIGVADDYPKHLIKEVYVSYGRALLRQERLSELKKLMQDLTVKLRKANLPPEALMLLARSAIIERNDPLAETLLSQAAASENLEVSFLAQYEFVSFLLSRGDLGVNQAIEHLENLRYLWRGGFVEQEILKKLGYMYINRGEQRQGLERLKYHNIYFPDASDQEEITELMMVAFTDLYLDETAMSKLDPLALLGLYYDYRELTPPGEKGDILIAQIADRLRNLGLFERAVDVLERQLKFRIKDEKVKGEMGRNLAQIYLLNQNYKESLNALVRTESPELDDDLTKSRQYIEAENYIALGEFAKAEKLLKGIDESRAIKLLAQIGWTKDEYKQVVNAYQKIYDDPKKLPFEWGEEEKLNFVRLAVAYNNLGRLRDLENLMKRYDRQLRNDDKILEVTEFLMKDQGSDLVSAKKEPKTLWDNLTNSLTAYHDFANFYDDVVQEREMDRRDKDIFNRRMRQISAPPRY